jgi:hypothetical protein
LLRSVIDLDAAPASLPTMYLEFVGGDTLPIAALGVHRPAQTSAADATAHLVVDPAPAIGIRLATRPTARIRTEALRKVVWQARGANAYEPATLFYRDGRQVVFRSLRWVEDGVRLLLEEETSHVPLDQIAEIHLPSLDAWQAYFDTLARLAPPAGAHLVQIESATGAMLTAVVDRVERRNSSDEPQASRYAAQPAWALDPIELAIDQVRVCRFFALHEVPLTSILPVDSSGTHALGAGWKYARTNRNVQDGPLRCARRDFAWGFGVQADHRLVFELPPLATRFRTAMGLDQAAGSGGCARGIVRLLDESADDREVERFRSPQFIGSARMVDSGWIKLPPSRGKPARLVLVADSCANDTPAAADPLDIRDCWDWLEPLIELDARRLADEIATRRPAEP